MSSWETSDMAAALPTKEGAPVNTAENATEKVNPASKGWAPKIKYDYETYTKSSKELHDQLAAGVKASGEDIMDAVGGIVPGDWANNGAIYEWKDEYGDVGPEFPELEQQLFGSANHVKAGIRFDELISSITVIQEGPVRIKPIISFAEAGLHPVMLRNVQLAGYVTPTPIQQYALPTIHQGYDLVAMAQTGSGKTAAFLIPILSKLMGKAKKLCAPRPNPALLEPGVSPVVRAEPLVLIVCPTRELATQIFDEARRFCYRTMLRPCVVYGGGPIAEQIAQLSKGCDLLIGTPGRLCDFINRPHNLTLRRLKYMVIDEADEMVGSDWESELKQIMSGGDQEEGNINYLMFSATFPKMAREMAKQHLAHDHVRIRVGRVGSTHKSIKQDIIFAEPSAKRKALFDIMMGLPPCRTIIFVNSKRTADEIDDYLFNLEFPCTSIHSDRTQREREDSIRAFRTGRAPILIATGVSSRGLDIHNVMHVINYDLPSPNFGGIQEYIHRIGRTARIGHHGTATSFYTSRDEDLAPMLVKLLLENSQVIPDFLTSFIPEGYTQEGEGDLAKLDWEDASDNGEGEGAENGGWGADAPSAEPASGGWGAPAVPSEATSGGWGAAPANLEPTPQVGGWTQPAPVPAPVAAPSAASWGASQTQAAQAPIQPWNAQPAPPQQQSWGPPPVVAVTQLQPPAAVSYGAPQHAMAPQTPVAAPLGVPQHQLAPQAPVAAPYGVPQHQLAPQAPVTTPSWNAPQQAPVAAPSWGQPQQAPRLQSPAMAAATQVQAAPANNGWGVQPQPQAQAQPATGDLSGSQWASGGGNYWSAGSGW